MTRHANISCPQQTIKATLGGGLRSTIDLIISRRFAKKQQMQWSRKGAHLLLQTRTRTLDGTLRDLFTSWYSAMPANESQPPSLAAAA
jgi:hypothetical protein